MLFAAAPAFADWEQGDALEVVKEVDLRKGPSWDTPSQGKIPVGAFVTYKGEEKDGYFFVAFDSEDGSLEGWVARPSVKKRSASNVKDEDIVPRRKPKAPPKKKAPVVPRDEEVLLKREPKFSYGFQGGWRYCILSAEDLPTDTFAGAGFSGGFHFSYFVDPTIRLRAEAGFGTLSGTRSNADVLGFNVLEMALLGEMMFRPAFVVYLGMQYTMGTGINDAPNSLALVGASDISSLWISAGAGYRFTVTDISFLTVRGGYTYGFSTSPVHIQTFGLGFYFEIQG